MSSQMMKIAGKTSDATARGIRVTDEGYVETARRWQTEAVTLLSQSAGALRSADTVTLEAADASDGAVLSLRIKTTLDKAVEIRFMEDVTDGGGTIALGSGNGETVYTVPEAYGGTRMLVVTSDDVPFLDHLRTVKLQITPADTPTSGYVAITLMKKG